MNKKHSDFFFEYYEKCRIPDSFSEVFYTQEEKIWRNSNYQEVKNLSLVNSVMFVPQYINPRVNNDLFNVKKITQFFKGYAILLDEFKSIDEYLKYRFKKNAKSIRKRIKRLELSFPISYHFYFGEISEKDYHFFMDTLKKMIINRFKERNDISQNLLNWEHYQKIFFDLINDKKASLFVIKNEEEPICVSISNHFNGKMFSSVSSYDIDFAKFSMGSIEIYKKLEWCIENSHNTYEFGMGDLSYKREWSNNIYNFEYQIIYPKKSIIAKIKATVEYIKVNLKESVYKLAYVRYKKWKTKRKKSIPFHPSYNVHSFEDIADYKSLSKIDYNLKSHSFLRKSVFDFLYSNMENVINVEVFELSKQEKSYLIIGQSNKQKIIFD